MNERIDFQVLVGLRKSEAYKKLMVLWLQDVSAIESKRDAAASRSQESAWRYHAGVERGYKDAILKLDVEIARLEEIGKDSLKPSETIEKLLAEVRGDDKP